MHISVKTKRSIMCCAVALILCFMLFLGSTAAWFSDSDVMINTFSLGEMKFQIVRPDGESFIVTDSVYFGRTDNYVNNPDDILFEPGATFKLPILYVKNLGGIPLNYKLKITLDKTTTNDDNAKLWDVIEFYAKIGDSEITDLTSFSAHVDVGSFSEPITVYAHMKEDAGNEYQDLTLSNVVVTFYGYQDGVTDGQVDNWYKNN